MAQVPFSYGETGITALTDERVYSAVGTRIAFTDRRGGVSSGVYGTLNLSKDVGDDERAVEENRHRVLDCLGAHDYRGALISPLQVHGSLVLEATDLEATRDVADEGVDGIVCTREGVPVLLKFADCVPVVCVAPDGAFAVIHAGWRGAIAGIPGIGLSKLAHAANVDARECNCYIGPHIGSCCYQVSADLLERFVERYGEACRRGEDHLDLSAAVSASLLRAGASRERIADADVCTACNTDIYYSHRAEDGKTGRHGAFACKEARTWD